MLKFNEVLIRSRIKAKASTEIRQDKLDSEGTMFPKLLSKLFIFNPKLIFNCHTFTNSTFTRDNKRCLKLSNPDLGLKSCIH